MPTRPILYKFALAAILLIIIGYLLAPYFAGTNEINPIAISLGNFTIHWYGVTMALGIVVCSLLALRVVRPQLKSISEDQLLTGFVWVIAGGLVGARLLFVLLKWPFYADNPASVINIWEGGLSLHGALLGGLLATLIYSSQAKINWKHLADIVAVTLPIGQAVGRFGNFFNQEAFGGPTNLPWKMFVEAEFRPEAHINSSYYHPTFLYEAILLIGLYIILRLRLAARLRPGQLLAIYLGGYSVIRFATEFFRVDSDYLGSLSIAQWASLAILAWSIIWYYQLRRHDT